MLTAELNKICSKLIISRIPYNASLQLELPLLTLYIVNFIVLNSVLLFQIKIFNCTTDLQKPYQVMTKFLSSLLNPYSVKFYFTAQL